MLIEDLKPGGKKMLHSVIEILEKSHIFYLQTLNVRNKMIRTPEKDPNYFWCSMTLLKG